MYENMDTNHPFSSRAVLIAVTVAAGLVYASYSGTLLKPVLSTDAIKSVPYLRSAITSFSDIAVMLFAVSLVARTKAIQLITVTGIGGPWRPVFLWAALVFTPVLVICVFLAKLSSDFTILTLVWLGIGSPIVEELLYRGLAIGVLMRLCGWKFLPACLLPALFFGLAHFSQGSDLSTVLGIVAITGAGGLLFGWLFVRWGFNIAPPLILHLGMNSLFVVFDLGDDAIGSWLLTGLRVVIVIIAVGVTFRLAPQNVQNNIRDYMD